MKLFALTCCLISFAISSALAQAPAPNPPHAAGSQAQSPNMNGAAEHSGKEVRAQFRNDADAKRLKGSAKRAAVQECFGKSRPDFAANEQCRKQG